MIEKLLWNLCLCLTCIVILPILNSGLYAQSEIDQSDKLHNFGNIDVKPVIKVCANLEDEFLRDFCSRIEISKRIYQELDKKEYDREEEGHSFLDFKIDKGGSVYDFNIFKAPSSEHEEALQETWTSIADDLDFNPGVHNKKEVPVTYTLTISFTDLAYDTIIDELRDKPFNNEREFIRSLKAEIYYNTKEFSLNKFLKQSHKKINMDMKHFYWIKGDERFIGLWEH